MRKRLDPTPEDFKDWEDLLYKGVGPAEAAKELGYTASGFRRSDPERHRKCLELSREAREREVDTAVEAWARHPEASDSMKQFWARRWNTNYEFGRRVEVTGADGGPLQLERREVGLHAVLGVLQDAGALELEEAGLSDDLADARALLPARANGEAGSVPPPRQP